MFKVRTKEDRKKSPVQEEPRTPLQRERSESEGRSKESSHGEYTLLYKVLY